MFPSLSRALAGVLVAIASVRAMPQTPTTSSAAAPSPSNTTSSSSVCNNSPTLCGRRYSDITFMGAHNSAFLRDQSTGNSLAGNQFKNATIALDAGIRLLQAQVHLENNELRLCHTSCSLLDAGPLTSWLAAINSWMTQHPQDVVTILLVNSDNVDASVFATAFQSSGLSRLGYAPPSKTEWPTLQSMIDRGTRMVSFITNIRASTAAPYLLPEFDYVFETHFEVTELTGFNCTLDRPSGAGTALTAYSNSLLGLVNHFKYQALTATILIPDADNIDIANSAATTTDGNLGRHLQQCNSEWQRRPNFVLVDFWDRGNTLQAADNTNNIREITGRELVNSTNSKNSGSSWTESSRTEQGALIAFIVATLLMV